MQRLCSSKEDERMIACSELGGMEPITPYTKKDWGNKNQNRIL
jgi:hypothetical protein